MEIPSALLILFLGAILLVVGLYSLGCYAFSSRTHRLSLFGSIVITIWGLCFCLLSFMLLDRAEGTGISRTALFFTLGFVGVLLIGISLWILFWSPFSVSLRTQGVSLLILGAFFLIAAIVVLTASDFDGRVSREINLIPEFSQIRGREVFGLPLGAWIGAAFLTANWAVFEQAFQWHKFIVANAAAAMLSAVLINYAS